MSPSLKDRALKDCTDFDRAFLRQQRPMIPILTFGRPDVFGRVAVSLGAELIGEIAPQDGDAVAYRVMLHGLSSAFRPAESAARARGAIEHVVNEWLTRLGLFYPGLGVDIVMPDADGTEQAVSQR